MCTSAFVLIYVNVVIYNLHSWHTILYTILHIILIYTTLQGDVAIVTSTVEYANISTGLYNKIKKAGKKGATVTYLPFFATNIFVRPPGTDT